MQSRAPKDNLPRPQLEDVQIEGRAVGWTYWVG